MMESNSSNNCIYYYNVEILYVFDPELQLINTKPMIKYKLKKFLSELKKFKIETTLVLEHKRRNDLKTFHASFKLIANYSDTDKAFKSMHQRIMTKIKNYAGKN